MRALLLLSMFVACRYEPRPDYFGHDGGLDATDAPADASPLLVGCEGWWSFEETDWSGGVVDHCGSNTGTPSGAAALEMDPVRGRVARTTSGCITVPDAPGLRGGSAMTIAAWIRPACKCVDEGIVAKRYGFSDNSAYALYLTKNVAQAYQLWVDIDGENDRFEHPEDLGATTGWRHVAVVFDGAQPATQRVAVYIDGRLDGYAPSESSTSITVPNTVAPPPVSIGCLPNGGTSFDGLLDDVTIWSRALSEAEVFAWAFGS